MRRLLTFILLSAVFLGGYYLGHRPGSPDIFAWAGRAYHRLTTTTDEITAKAEKENTSLPKAALSSLLDSESQDRQEPKRR